MGWTTVSKPVTGTYLSKATFGDLVVDDLNYLYALRDESVWVPINGSVALVNGDKAYLRVPAKLNGATIVSVAAACKDPSTSGAVELSVKNGATSVLSTNITLDASENDTLTAAVPAVIDTDEDDVATGDFIEVAVVSAGTGVTYCGVEIVFRPGD